MDKTLRLFLYLALLSTPAYAITPQAIIGRPTSGSPVCGSYLHYRVITVPAQSGLSGNLSNYPVLVSGTYSYLATVANGGLVQNANGYDVGFFTDNTCTTKLPWETETYTAGSGLVNYWVQVPTVSKTTSITFIEAYDAASITTDQSNPTGVWDANFWAVYHMANAAVDSTASGNVMTATGGTISGGTGEVDGSQVFSGTTYYTRGGGGGGVNNPTGNVPMTLSAWVNVASYGTSCTTEPCMISAIGTDGASPTAYFLGMKSTGAAWTGFASTPSSEATSSATASGGTWAFVTAVYDGTTNKVYLNAGSSGSVTYGAAGITGHTQRIGNYISNCCGLTGSIDEVRFSAVARSLDWITTDYANQSSPATFYSVGSQF